MTPVDYALRAFILCVLALTTLSCIARAIRSDEVRAAAGNAAFGALAGVIAYAQVPFRSTPPTTVTWLLGGACCVCIPYLISLARRGLT